MQRIIFDIGESRHVRLLIKSINNLPFTIRNAAWELVKSGEIVDQGECIITDHIIDALITPTEKATYKLRFIYQIADEILIEVIEVAVI